MKIQASFHRWLRRQILARGRAMPPARMLALSLQGALKAARDAAHRSSAYRQLLAEHGVESADLKAASDLRRLPVLTKDNTFGRFSLHELAGPFDPGSMADVLTSSGRGGRTFGFRLSSQRAHERAWFDIDLGLQDAFDVDRQPTLIVNCLPMGVTFPSRAATVANVSVREDMACAILKNVGAHYQQVVVCTDPLFVNRLLAEGRQRGVDWPALNASFVLGEEMLVEAQREHIARHIGLDIDRDPRRWIGSSFGVGELGLNLLFETRETVRLNRAAQCDVGLAQALGGPAPSTDDGEALLFCYNPLRCHLEVLDPDEAGWGELCFTMLGRDAQIPLPRYTTGDVGRLVPRDQAAAAAAGRGLATPWLPMVSVRGRRADRPHGLPSVERVKALIYRDATLADHLTGAFRLGWGNDWRVRLELQLAPWRGNAAPPQASLARLAAALGPNADVRLQQPDPGAWGPALDHERKFAYVAPAR